MKMPKVNALTLPRVFSSLALNNKLMDPRHLSTYWGTFSGHRNGGAEGDCR